MKRNFFFKKGTHWQSLVYSQHCFEACKLVALVMRHTAIIPPSMSPTVTNSDLDLDNVNGHWPCPTPKPASPWPTPNFSSNRPAAAWPAHYSTTRYIPVSRLPYITINCPKLFLIIQEYSRWLYNRNPDRHNHFRDRKTSESLERLTSRTLSPAPETLPRFILTSSSTIITVLNLRKFSRTHGNSVLPNHSHPQSAPRLPRHPELPPLNSSSPRSTFDGNAMVVVLKIVSAVTIDFWRGYVTVEWASSSPICSGPRHHN